MTYHPRRPTKTLGQEAIEVYVDFFRKLEPGQKHVYFTGYHASGDWCVAARWAYERGLGALVQKRIALPDGGSTFEYIFQRGRGRK